MVGAAGPAPVVSCTRACTPTMSGAPATGPSRLAPSALKCFLAKASTSEARAAAGRRRKRKSGPKMSRSGSYGWPAAPARPPVEGLNSRACRKREVAR